jgi:hypothetical protein
MNWHFDHPVGFPAVAFAPEIFSRVITYKEEIGLDQKQLNKIIAMKRDYSLFYHDIGAEIDNVVEKIDKFIHKDDLNINDVYTMIDKHAELIVKLERKFFEMTITGSKILSKDQVQRLRSIYHRDKSKAPKMYK